MTQKKGNKIIIDVTFVNKKKSVVYPIKRKFRILPLSTNIQQLLWFFGIAWHNVIRDTCTKDFNCCENMGRKAWIKFPRKNEI